MPAPRRPSVEVLREATARACEIESLRSVADEIGMAPSWLSAFNRGKIRVLHDETRRRLYDWYVKWLPRLRRLDAEGARAALAYPLAGLLVDAERDEAYDELLQVLRRHYEKDGPLPDWLRRLLDE